MNSWDRRYAERVNLLVQILPVLAEEKRFALKGGTAINLFELDMPRLSVDIDLTWLPVGDFAEDLGEITDALEHLGTKLRSGPLRLKVQSSGSDSTGTYRLVAPLSGECRMNSGRAGDTVSVWAHLLNLPKRQRDDFSAMLGRPCLVSTYGALS